MVFSGRSVYFDIDSSFFIDNSLRRQYVFSDEDSNGIIGLRYYLLQVEIENAES
jgi:hypothetical protein